MRDTVSIVHSVWNSAVYNAQKSPIRNADDILSRIFE